MHYRVRATVIHKLIFYEYRKGKTATETLRIICQI